MKGNGVLPIKILKQNIGIVCLTQPYEFGWVESEYDVAAFFPGVGLDRGFSGVIKQPLITNLGHLVATSCVEHIFDFITFVSCEYCQYDNIPGTAMVIQIVLGPPLKIPV